MTQRLSHRSVKEMKDVVALIVSRSPGALAIFKHFSQILSNKYDVHLYLLPQMPKFLSRFFAWLTKIPSAGSPSNPKKQVNSQTAVCRACKCFKSVSAKLIAIPKTVIARFYLFMLSFYVSLRYDLVISHDIHWSGAISTLCAKIFRKKSIIFVIGNYFDEIKIRHKGISGILTLKLLSILEYISIHLADVIVFTDYKVMAHLKRKRAKIAVFWKKFAMVDIHQFSYDDKIRKIYREKLGIPNSDPVLLFVGWLTEWDGADIALNIYRALSKEKNNLWLIFIGSGILEAHIKKAIIEENLQKVKLTGYIPHNEIHNYMMVGDIALMPLREPQCGIGNISVELMAIGILIITTDVGMLREVIIDEETGFIVKDDVVGEMVQRINLLLKSPDLIRKMGRNARKMVEQDFSPESISSKVFSLIDTCMDS